MANLKIFRFFFKLESLFGRLAGFFRSLADPQEEIYCIFRQYFFTFCLKKFVFGFESGFGKKAGFRIRIQNTFLKLYLV
jgi:hypothetical protein